MYYCQLLDAGGIDALQGTNPQLKVGVDGILDEYWDVEAGEAVSSGPEA